MTSASLERRTRLRFALLVAPLALLAPFSLDTYLPSFPAMAADLSVDGAAMQATLSSYLVAFALATLVAGPLSDAFGRRPVVLWALVAYVATSALLVVAVEYWQVVGLRVGQGFAAAAGVVVSRALVRDRFDPIDARRVFAIVTIMFAMGPAIAPILGGYLQSAFGWRSVFAFLVLYGVVLLLAARLWLPETLPPVGRVSSRPRLVLGRYAGTLRNVQFLQPVLVHTTLFGAKFLFVAASPALIYVHLGGGERDFWWLFAPMVVGLMLGGVASGWSAGRVAPEVTVRIGLLLTGISLALVGWAALDPEPSVAAVTLPFALYSFALALGMPSLTLLALDCYPGARGMASAMQAFIQLGFAALLTLFVVDWLDDVLLHLVAGAAVIWLFAALVWFGGGLGKR
ncbi:MULTISPECIES: multidrug effflux MFS transporter [unclassified Thioalkalivibrio]|uniref:multidrug effflux MFS transporter n=1 Tax=unclassified Thioalkalivibrio TaxID=2621013 RepID=UPI000367D558|nr:MULTISPECIES: multidrug effflux MFS transporter [unclassified Thioalkalivibrio]